MIYLYCYIWPYMCELTPIFLESSTWELLCREYVSSISNPVDRGRNFNVQKTFRRRPGRLLNVLCTFKLRLVSTGKVTDRLLTLKYSRLRLNSYYSAPKLTKFLYLFLCLKISFSLHLLIKSNRWFASLRSFPLICF